MCLRWHFDSITKIVLCACDDGIWRALCPHRNDVIWLEVGNNLDLWRNTGHLGISHSMSSPKSSSSLCSVTSSSTLICDLKVGSCYDTRWWRLWWWCRYWCRRWYYDIDNWMTLGVLAYLHHRVVNIVAVILVIIIMAIITISDIILITNLGPSLNILASHTYEPLLGRCPAGRQANIWPG